MEKGGTAYPHFAILDAQGELMAKIYEPHSLAGFKETVERLGRLDRLREKAAAGDRQAKFEAGLLRCDLGRITYGELEESTETLGELGEAQKAALRRREVNEELETLHALARSARDPKLREGVMEDLFALHAEGAYPTRSDLNLWFWWSIARRAVRQGAATDLRQAIQELKSVVKGSTRDCSSLSCTTPLRWRKRPKSSMTRSSGG